MISDYIDALNIYDRGSIYDLNFWDDKKMDLTEFYSQLKEQKGKGNKARKAWEPPKFERKCK